MLTKLSIKNFKMFDDVEIELGNPVVFVGPNNSGKTTALQALALWHAATLGLAPSKTTINRNDLFASVVPSVEFLWRALRTQQDRMVVTVEGYRDNTPWNLGFEFDYANAESFYAKPVHHFPPGFHQPVAFLPPLSGLADREFVKQRGEIDFLIGQGRTAEVFRNVCHRASQNAKAWQRIREVIKSSFGALLDEPHLNGQWNSIQLNYKDRDEVRLDISCAGRGMLQVILLLAFMSVNRGSVILLDEPDAHLESLRQRETYRLLVDFAKETDCQLIIATHSEAVLREAAETDVLISFAGAPTRVDDRGTQALKALREIPYEDFLTARERGWILYVEGSTDFEILRSLARKLNHPVETALADTFVKYIGNDPQAARNHFHGIKHGLPHLRGFVLCDRLDRKLQPAGDLCERMWSRREIENYLCDAVTLNKFAEKEHSAGGLMSECIEEFVPRVALSDPADRWWIETKTSDQFLDRLFAKFYEHLRLPNLMAKSNYHRLAEYVDIQHLDREVIAVLDEIWNVSQRLS